MSEVNGLVEVAKAVGIPALFALVILGLGLKYIPKFLDAWLETRRQMLEQASRSIEAAARCEAALIRASDVIAKSTEVSERVLYVLSERFEVRD
ncbi:MAG: hypothetical protein LBN02_04140 [Oscillospiraceae bacterium]|jgi:hypothetical protein|nr:hypothetical protein [Oscillospiraceae bacterium]